MTPNKDSFLHGQYLVYGPYRHKNHTDQAWSNLIALLQRYFVTVGTVSFGGGYGFVLVEIFFKSFPLSYLKRAALSPLVVLFRIKIHLAEARCIVWQSLRFIT